MPAWSARSGAASWEEVEILEIDIGALELFREEVDGLRSCNLENTCSGTCVSTCKNSCRITNK
jgi:hypothetical protein